jgi:hypothetical protein
VQGGDDIVLTTSAVAKQLQGTGTFRVTCKTPEMTAEHVPSSEWKSVFEVLEGDHVLAFQGATAAPTINFQSVGPVIAPMADHLVYITELKKDAVRYPESKVETLVALSDQDTDAEDIEVAIVSSRADLLPVGGIALEGTP